MLSNTPTLTEMIQAIQVLEQAQIRIALDMTDPASPVAYITTDGSDPLGGGE